MREIVIKGDFTAEGINKKPLKYLKLIVPEELIWVAEFEDEGVKP